MFLDCLSHFPPQVEPHLPLLSPTSAARVVGKSGRRNAGRIKAMKAEKEGIASVFSVQQASLLVAPTTVLLSLLPREAESLPRKMISSSLLITGLTAELAEKHPNLWDFLLLTSARWSAPIGRLARLSLLHLHSWYQQAAIQSWRNRSVMPLSYQIFTKNNCQPSSATAKQGVAGTKVQAGCEKWKTLTKSFKQSKIES